MMMQRARHSRGKESLIVTPPPTLSIRRLVKSYRRRTALSGVDLTIERGAWVALVGPNGAGKTTLLRSVIGLVTPDAGSIDFEGAGIEPTIRRAALGYAPQDNALYASLTVREHLEAFASLLGLERKTRRERVDEALDFSQLRDRARDQVRALSGGMKRRLNIGCAVLNRPRLLLLDEPTTGVDPLSRASIWEMLRRLRAGGTAILHATHRLDEVEFLCDEATILGDGRVHYQGSLEHLRETSGLPAYVLQYPGGSAEDGEPVIRSMNVTSPAELPSTIERLTREGANPDTIRINPTSFETVFQALVSKGGPS